jgi:hypothetical protein
MSSALRKLVANASKCNCTVIFINQLRSKVCAARAPHSLDLRGNRGDLAFVPFLIQMQLDNVFRCAPGYSNKVADSPQRTQKMFMWCRAYGVGLMVSGLCNTG